MPLERASPNKSPLETLSALLNKTHQIGRNKNDPKMMLVKDFSKAVPLKDKETEVLVRICNLCVSLYFPSLSKNGYHHFPKT